MTIRDCSVCDFLLLLLESAVLGIGSALILGFLFLGGKEFFKQLFNDYESDDGIVHHNKGPACPKGE